MSAVIKIYVFLHVIMAFFARFFMFSVLNETYLSIFQIIPLDIEGQKMLGALQESTATLFYYQLKTRLAMEWYKKALNSVESLLEDMLNDLDKTLLLERKGIIITIIIINTRKLPILRT